MRKQMEFVRKKTLDTLEAIAKQPDALKVLGWRPGPGRAHIGWQLMHIAATDDRHIYVRIGGGQAKEPGYVERFAGGSTPDDQLPAVEEMRRYLAERRAATLALLESASDEAFAKKPYDASPYTLEEWFRVWTWHEAHHQGQAHLTWNMYKAAQS